MSSKPVVTRFAPSPTGYLHVGGARTALFNWAFARKHGGQFILRLEDTDQARSTLQSARNIIEDLNWLGIDWDQGPNPRGDDPYSNQIGPHGPYCQSQRLELYRQYVDKLLTEGKAYKCFRTPAELAADRQAALAAKRPYKYDGAASRALTADQAAALTAQGKPHVVRFLMPDRPVTIHDSVLGDITVQPAELEDFIILKGDGFPTYHLAVVVDDATMGVTHVLRAQEHLNNTPKHLALQEALGIEHPIYAHMPLIFNADATKMSKRDKAKVARQSARDWIKASGTTPDALAAKASIEPAELQAFLDKKSDEVSIAQSLAAALNVTLPEIDVHDFRASGYLPAVLCNYLSLLGWSPGDDIEKFDLEFLVRKFDLSRIGKTNARFDRDKLFRFNADAVTALPPDVYVKLLRAWCDAFAPAFSRRFDDAAFAKLAGAYQARSRTLREPSENGRFFILPDDQITPEAKSVEKVLVKDDGYGILRKLEPLLGSCEPWDAQTIQAALDGFAERESIGMGKIAQPLRVALTGSTVSPPIYDTLEILGKPATLNRIQRCLAQAR